MPRAAVIRAAANKPQKPQQQKPGVVLHPGRVENWRGGPAGLWLGCIRGFPLRARLAVSVAPFPVPATSHAACGFPALRAPAHFVSKLMGPIHMAQLPCTTVGKLPGTHQRAPVSGTVRPGSIASTQIPSADGLCPDGAGSSFLPSLGCTRNTNSNGRPQRPPEEWMVSGGGSMRTDWQSDSSTFAVKATSA